MKSLPIHQITAGLLLAICVSPVCAVKPGKWVNSTEADFAQGKTEATVITNLNQIKLASGTSKLGELPDPLTMVNRVVNLGDKTFLAAGPEGQVLTLAGGKLETLLTLPEHQIFAMTALDKDHLLVAASGEPSRLLALSSSGDSRTLVELEGIRYLWDVLVIDGKVYLATGIQGRLLEVTLAELEPVTAESSAQEPQTKPETDKAESKSKSTTDTKPESSPNSDKSEIQDSKSDNATSTEPAQTQPVYPKGVREIFHAKQNNLLCLGSDGQKRMYLGTDTDGLVYRLTPPKPPATEFEIFVLLDAQEPEIGTILVQADGTVYVGTADANQARPGRMTDATTMPMGRLEEMEDQDAPAEGDAPSVTPKTAPRSPNPGLKHETDQSAKPNAAAHESKQGTTLNAHAPASTPDADPLREIIQQQLQKPQPRPQPDSERDAPKDAPPAAGVFFIPADADGMDMPGETDGFDGSDQPDGPGMMQRAMRGQLMAGMMSGMEPGMGGMHQGNAVYRIDPHGFVTELFRETAMILQLAQHQGSLLVTTGNEGMIFRIDTDAQETLRLVDLEPQQISALAMSPTGEFILGTANPAQLIRLHHGFADKGNYISPSLEAQQISLWGKLLLRAQVPANTSLTVQTRSGNVQDPEHAPWSAWSEPMKWEAVDPSTMAIDRSFTVTSPPARFLQYRLNFTGTPELSPTASRVELAYITPNQKPAIAAVRAIHPHLQDEGGMMPGQMGGGFGGGPSGGGPGSMGMPRGMNPAMMRAMMQQSQGPMGGPGGMNTNDLPEVPPTLPIEWDASDPNGDTLQFKLEYQPMGTGTWILLEKELAEPRYDWPIKRMPDGWYYVRVTASDHPDNTPAMAMTATRISDPILIDNTPPEFRDVQTQLSEGQWTLTAEVSDALSPIREVRYTLHGMKDWQTVLPDDKIYDSTNERITIKLTDLGSGPALVTVRALDSMGQARFHAVMLNVKP